EKYAVRCGGGANHRIGLYDGILIKDNHLAGLGGDVRKAVEAARAFPGNAGLPVEVEVDTPEQLEVALAVRADIVLLDNMTPDQQRAAVARRDAVAPGVLLEASGGVNLSTVRDIAAALLAAHHEPGLAVVADHQTAGRGQYGRVWQARPGSSLLMSVALKPPSELCRPVILTALAAVAVGDAILSLIGTQTRIKWPN